MTKLILFQNEDYFTNNTPCCLYNNFAKFIKVKSLLWSRINRTSNK